MNADGSVESRILDAARQVHAALGAGFLESIYGRALAAELRSRGMMVEREKVIRIWYGDLMVGRHLLDLVVEGAVIVELKANRGIASVHLAQVRSYLHAADYRVGLVLNFGLAELQWELLRRDEGQAPGVPMVR